MLYVLILLALLVLAYVLEGRAWLKTKPWTQGLFAWIEPCEIALYKKSETLLAGRLLSVGGFLVSAYDTLALAVPQLDLTPVTNRLLHQVPDDLRGLVLSGACVGAGQLISWLRKRTSTPLEIVALPDDMPPEVAAKVEQAQDVKEQAVAAVQDAKAAGAV